MGVSINAARNNCRRLTVARRWTRLAGVLGAMGLLAVGCRPDGGSGSDEPPPTGMPEPGEPVCAALCGDGTCDPAFEDCGSCTADCAAAECSEGSLAFLPGHTAIALGNAWEDRCGTGVVTPNPGGLAEGSEAMPFEQNPRPLATPVGCGGVADAEPTIAAGLSLQDGSLGSTMGCLSLASQAKSPPIGVGLRHEIGRWREPDPGSHPGDYERPGTQGLGQFWFASYSRRFHGDVPTWQLEPWAKDELPDELTLFLENYESYRFVREGSSGTYLQPGVDSTSASVAFVELVDDADPEACVSAGDPFRFIANNDLVLHYADGSRDVFSGRDLTFKGHIAENLSHLVVTHGVVDTEGGPSCGGGEGAVGIKRIASYPAFSNEPLAWVELEHAYVEQPRPGYQGQLVGAWKLQRIVDSAGRTTTVEHDPDNAGQILGVTIFEGAPDVRHIAFGHDDVGVIDSISMPAAGGDEQNVVTMVHDHPSAQGGASRVLSQTRTISGELETTTMSWGDAQTDLEVRLPGGHYQLFAHEEPQGSTQEPLRAEGRNDNRLVELYPIDASFSPERIMYDAHTGQISERCDQMSPGPLDGTLIGRRCVGFEYNDDHDLVEVVSWGEGADEARTTMEYDYFEPGNNHRLSRLTGPMGDETVHHYEVDAWLGGRVETPRLVESIDTLGNVTTIEWCEGTSTCPYGMISATVSPVGGRTDLVYDPVTGTLMLTRDGDLVQQRTAYDSRGCVVARDSRDGISTVVVYDSGQGDCLPRQIIENPNGEGDERRVTIFEYDEARNLIRTITDAEGEQSNSASISETDYQVVDAEGSFGAIRERDGVGGLSASETIVTRSPLGEVVGLFEVEMDRSIQTEYNRDNIGELTIVSTRSGIAGSSIKRLNAAGQLIESVDEIGLTNAFEYSDRSGRLVTESMGEGEEMVSSRYEYALDGELVKLSEPDDVVTEFFYDEARRQVGQERAGVRETVELDGAGRPIARHRTLATGEEINTEMTYTEEGRGSRLQSTTLLATGNGEPATATHHYETEAMPWGACQLSNPGNCYDYTRVEMPRTQAEASLYRLMRKDGLGRLVEATTVGTESSDRASFTYAYDGLNCIREISGGGGTQLFECDEKGQRVTETAWETRSWDYYPDGSLRTFEDFNGTTTQYELDDTRWRTGRVHYSNEPDGVVHTQDVELIYLDNDLLSSMVDGSGTTAYAYDSLGRVRSRTHTPSSGSEPLTLGYEYEPGSLRLSRLDYWGQEAVHYVYDNRGQVAVATAFGLNQAYDYADDGRIRSSATGLASQVMSTVYGYDSLRRVTDINHKLGLPDGSGTPLLDLHYDELDMHGNVGRTREDWGYDEPPINDSFTYDENDRLTEWNHGFREAEFWSDDEGDEYLGSSGINEYDERGNAVTFMGRSFEYDSHDRITSDGFAYDNNGNLVCLDDSGECHCINGVQDDDETGVDCGGSDCPCCLAGEGSVEPPAFVGTACPTVNGEVDFDALRSEATMYHDPESLMFTMEIPYDTPGCSSVPLELPVPCGESSYQDYRLWRMGGAIQPMIIPFVSPNWVHNPSYYADGMMDPFYEHPAKEFFVDCNNGGADGSMCAIGAYGDGLSDSSLEPCNMARQDPSQGPQQPGPTAYDGNIRAFPVYQRDSPNLLMPEGYQLCYDIVDLHAQGGALPVCQSAGAGYHGSVFVAFQGVGACI